MYLSSLSTKPISSTTPWGTVCVCVCVCLCVCVCVCVFVCVSDIYTLCLSRVLCGVPRQPCISLCVINQPDLGGPCIKQMDWPDRWGPICHLPNLAWPAMRLTLQVKADGWIMAVMALQAHREMH